jgi:hypothetical protein
MAAVQSQYHFSCINILKLITESLKNSGFQAENHKSWVKHKIK